MVMKRSSLLAIGVALVIASGGCTQTPSAGPTPAPSVASSVSAPATQSRTAAIYTAVLRRYLTSGDSSSSGSFHHVYVWSTATPSASDPMRSVSDPPVGVEISAEDQASIAAALSNLPIQFVDNTAGLFESPSGCTTVRDGILITLGPPEGAGDDVTVAISGFFACLGATWLTYAVSRDGAEWRVTGNVGGVAIA
jgi:hypothetical protein